MIEPVARLRIELREIEPRLWRRVDVPLSSTLLALHDVIQTVVGWTDSHLFEFVGRRARLTTSPCPMTTSGTATTCTRPPASA